jgi:hypothetical protein
MFILAFLGIAALFFFLIFGFVTKKGGRPT